MVAHRRSSPGIAGASRISFFFTGLYCFSFLLNHLSWQRRASLASLPILPRASFVASLGIAAHRWASHRCVSFLASPGISRFFTASYGWASQVIAGNCWPFLDIVFFTGLYCVSFSFHYLSWHRRASRASLRISPGIAGHLSFPWYRCASLGIAAFILL